MADASIALRAARRGARRGAARTFSSTYTLSPSQIQTSGWLAATAPHMGCSWSCLEHEPKAKRAAGAPGARTAPREPTTSGVPSASGAGSGAPT